MKAWLWLFERAFHFPFFRLSFPLPLPLPSSLPHEPRRRHEISITLWNTTSRKYPLPPQRTQEITCLVTTHTHQDRLRKHLSRSLATTHHTSSCFILPLTFHSQNSIMNSCKISVHSYLLFLYDDPPTTPPPPNPLTYPFPLMLCCLLNSLLVVNTAVVLVVLDCFLYNILNVTFVSVPSLRTSRLPSSVGPVPGWVTFVWLERVAFISGAQKLEEGVSALGKRFGPHLRR